MLLPDYQGGSIVNLIASIEAGMGNEAPLYAPLRQLEPARLRNARNVVLLVIDGLGHDYLTGPGAGSTLHQYLKGRITSVCPPTTASAITTMLTAMAPQQHAITGWFTYFKELGSVITVLPFRPRHGGPPLSESGIEAGALLQPSPLFDRLVTRSYVVSPERIADSDFNRVHAGAAEVRAYGSLKEMFTTVKAILRENDARKYVYSYWPALDGLAHEHGIGSVQVRDHFAELDAAFHRFVSTIRGSETLIVVTADHGIIDTAPERAIHLDQHPVLAGTLRLPLCGERRFAYCYIDPAKRQQFERYVEEALAGCATLFRSEQLLEKGCFGLGAPHPRLLERIGDYTLVMRENYTIKDQVLGERPYVHIGVHGGQSEQELYVPLIIVEA